MSNKSRIQEMLAAVKGDDALKNALRIISVNAAARAENDEDIENAFSTIVSSVNDAYKLNDDQKTLLDNYETFLDAKLTDYLNMLESTITNRGEALMAIQNYDIKKFRTIPMSVNAKQSIAGMLHNLCNRYVKSGNGFWISLVNGDSEVMANVMFSTSYHVKLED